MRISSGTYVFFHGVQDQGFEFIEAIVDASPSALLHDGLVTLQQSRNTTVSDKSWDKFKKKSGARASRLAASARPHRAKGQSRARSRIYSGARRPGTRPNTR